MRSTDVLTKRAQRLLDALPPAPGASTHAMAYLTDDEVPTVAAIAASVGCGISELCTPSNLHKVTDDQLDELQRIVLAHEHEQC